MFKMSEWSCQNFWRKKNCCHFLLGLKGMPVRFASQNTSCPEASSFILFYSSQWNFFFNVVSRVWSFILIIRSWFLFKPLLMREKEFCSFQFWYVIFSLLKKKPLLLNLYVGWKMLMIIPDFCIVQWHQKSYLFC